MKKYIYEDLDVDDNKKISDAIAQAKSETKDIKSKDDVTQFLNDNKNEILKVEKKLNGKQKEQFKTIVNSLNVYSKDVKEAKNNVSSKIICGLAATVAFICGLNTIGFIASAPLYGPILEFAVSKLTNAAK